MTEELKSKLWKLIDEYADATQKISIGCSWGNVEPEELDELQRTKDAISEFMEVF